MELNIQEDGRYFINIRFISTTIRDFKMFGLEWHIVDCLKALVLVHNMFATGRFCYSLLLYKSFRKERW